VLKLKSQCEPIIDILAVLILAKFEMKAQFLFFVVITKYFLQFLYTNIDNLTPDKVASQRTSALGEIEVPTIHNS